MSSPFSNFLFTLTIHSKCTTGNKNNKGNYFYHFILSSLLVYLIIPYSKRKSNRQNKQICGPPFVENDGIARADFRQVPKAQVLRPGHTQHKFVLFAIIIELKFPFRIKYIYIFKTYSKMIDKMSLVIIYLLFSLGC